jgi:DNA invertase Pin-like site-specific DNA recombinase
MSRATATPTARPTPAGTTRRGRQVRSDQMRAESDTPPRPLYLAVTRVSTEEQVTNGHSMDAQDAALTAEAARRGWDVEVVPIPARSGKAMSPELRGVLGRLARGEAAGLLVTKLDRLTRRVSIASDVIATAQREGWNLVVTDLGIDLSTWQGRAMAHMLATFAEVERELISERTRDGMAAARANGTKTGRAIGRPATCPPDIVRWICEQRGAGNSYRLIAEDLTARGIPSPEGRPSWQASTVRRAYNRAVADGA